MTVTLPDELLELVRGELPGLVVSQVLQEALQARLRCDHQVLRCARCKGLVDVEALVAARLAQFVMVLDRRVEDLVVSKMGGTAEGAARVLRDMARSFGVDLSSVPLPRPTRARRAEQKQRQYLAGLRRSS